MDGLINLLKFLNSHWTSICVVLGLIIGISKKVYAFMQKSDEEKIEYAKTQIKAILLKMVSEAEMDYEDWNKAGSIKRSQVIKKIFEMYPILLKATNQDAVINWIDYQIDSSLETLAEVIKQNKDEVVVDGE